MIGSDHPNARLVRQDFAALAAGDLEPVFGRMTDDFRMVNDIGAGPWHDLHGKDAVLDFWTRWMELFENTFRQDITDVVGYDDGAVAMIHEHGTAAGARFDNRAIYMMWMRDGKWCEMRTLDMDREAIEAFWATVGVPA